MVYMQAPKTYTREDVVEIHCHGGMIPVRRILELLMKKVPAWLSRESLPRGL